MVGVIPPSSTAKAGPPPEIAAALKAASAGSGVDFSYLVSTAQAESGFRAQAKASTSSATGLFQFTQGTWLETVRQHGASAGLAKEAAALESGSLDAAGKRALLDLRDDPRISARMAAEFTADNKRHLERTVGGNIGSGELYIAHFLGAGGAQKFIQAARTDATRPAATLFPDAAAANPSIFYEGGRARSVAEVYGKLAGKVGGAAAADLATRAATAATTSIAATTSAAATVAAPATATAVASSAADDDGATASGAGGRPFMLSPVQTQLLLANLRAPGETGDNL